MERSWSPESRLPWNTYHMWNIRLICDPICTFFSQLHFLEKHIQWEVYIIGTLTIHESMFQCWVGIKNCIKAPNWLPGQFLGFIDHKLVGFSTTNSNNCSQNLLFLCLFFYEKLSVLSGFWNGNWNQWFFDSDFFYYKKVQNQQFSDSSNIVLLDRIGQQTAK